MIGVTCTCIRKIKVKEGKVEKGWIILSCRV